MNEVRSGALDDEIDLRSIVDVLLKGWKPVVISIIAFVLVGCLYLMIRPPIYRADITIQVEDSTDLASAAIGNVVGGLANLFDVKSTDDGEMEVLRSRLVTEKPVDHLALYVDAKPKRIALIGDWIARGREGLSTPGLLGRGGYTWGAERIKVTRFEVPRNFERDAFRVEVLDAHTYRLSGGDMDGGVTGRVGTLLTVPTRQGDITLVVQELEGRRGAIFELRRHARLKVLDDLRAALKIEKRGENQSGVIGVTYDHEDPVLASAILNEIADSYVGQNRARKAETATQSLKFLEAQLPEVHRHLKAAEDRLTDYQDRRKVVDLGEQAKAMLGQAVQTQGMLFELEQKRKSLVATFSANHPVIVALDSQIAAAQATLGDFEASLRELPEGQQGIVRLTRDVRVQTEIYIGLVNSIQQLSLAKAGGVGNVRVVDRAVVGEQPIRPEKTIVFVVALLAGVMFGVGMTFTLAAIAGTLNDPDEVERETLLDVIGTVPVSSARRRVGRLQHRSAGEHEVLALRMPYDLAVEALRSLRTAVQFALAEREGNRIILVTGPLPGVGKSFIAANLAVLLGLAGKRVLLVDADLRRGRLIEAFGRSERSGLSDVLGAHHLLDETIVRTVAKNLDLLAAGNVVMDPDELLMTGRVNQVLRDLAVQYDIVLIDSPPLLPVADTAILAPLADLVLLVVRAGVTTRGEVLESVKRLQRAGTQMRYAVFNGFRPGLRASQYGHYAEYYGHDRAQEQ